ncbi:hypothetical protein G6703_02210 [Polynucleobacter paneuropaeus]|nr:hypothetical protein G6703_02210 [Polynucleobacter paneuropaeus]
MTKQILLTSFLAFFSTVSFSQSLIPLDRYVKERNLGDPTEFAYVGQRCAALSNMVSALLQENGTSKDAQSISVMNQRSEVFRNVALTLDLGANKKSMDAIISQSKKLSEIYVKQMVENKKVNNNYFDGYIQKDLEICTALYPNYEELNKKIPK